VSIDIRREENEGISLKKTRSLSELLMITPNKEDPDPELEQ
jgi:hypothetical protein